MYIDVHCHLDMLEKEGADLDRIMKGARKNKVGIIVTNSINSSSTRKSLVYKKKYGGVEIAAGIYPINALKISDKEINWEIDFIRKLAKKENIFAIGEVGIDHKWSTDEKEWIRQREIFRKFIKLSIELGVPIIVHSRKAEEECIEILESEKAKKVIMHSFGGKKSLVKRIVDNSWYFSIPASVKNSQHFQSIVKSVPIDKLLCETDSPYLHPDRKFPNEPANVVESYRGIAKANKLKLRDVEKKIEANFKELFGKI
jgi:TatD DNase family protein